MSMRISASICRRCGTKLDGATAVDGDATPTEGAVSICWSCGTVAFFDANLMLREPTVEEVRELVADPEISRVLSSLWDRRLARVVEGEGGVRFRCGCRTTTGGGLFSLESCAENCAAAQMVLQACEEQGKPVMVIR